MCLVVVIRKGGLRLLQTADFALVVFGDKDCDKNVRVGCNVTVF